MKAIVVFCSDEFICEKNWIYVYVGGYYIAYYSIGLRANVEKKEKVKDCCTKKESIQG